MRKLKYILSIMLSMAFLNSCLVDDSTDFELNDTGKNVVAFNLISTNLSVAATGLDKTVSFDIKIVGPSISKLANDITFNIEADPTSTAVVNTHYKILTPTITLKKSENYLAKVQVAIITEGNAPLEDGDEGYEEWLETYKAPVLNLKPTNVIGEDNVVGTGKPLGIKILYVSYNFFAGDYAVQMYYRHPAYGTYPNNVYGGLRELDETFTALSSKKAETGFGVWGPDDKMAVTIDKDSYLVTEIERYEGTAPSLGDPYDATKISHYDPVDGKIYLYYHYAGAPTGGDPYRIFWAEYTPKN